MSKSLGSPCSPGIAGDPPPLLSPTTKDAQEVTAPADLGLGVNAVEEQVSALLNMCK